MRVWLTRMVAAGGIAVMAAAPAVAQQFTMKLSQPTINDVTYEYFKRMKAAIEQRSAGKIKVEIYPSHQLGQLPVVVEGVALRDCGDLACDRGCGLGEWLLGQP